MAALVAGSPRKSYFARVKPGFSHFFLGILRLQYDGRQGKPHRRLVGAEHPCFFASKRLKHTLTNTSDFMPIGAGSEDLRVVNSMTIWQRLNTALLLLIILLVAAFALTLWVERTRENTVHLSDQLADALPERRTA